LPAFNYVYSIGLINRTPASKHFLTHRELVEVLEEGDVEKFGFAMRAHLENHYCRIFGMDSE
jgi:DNA-binding FadR family transcriptional regulator